MLESAEQRIGERAETGTDLDDAVVAPRRDGVDDVGDDLTVDQEILAKTLARNVLVHATDLNSSVSA